MSAPLLLWIFELGGYPDFTPLWQRLGYRVVRADSVRKAQALLKAEAPAAVVAELNFQSQFRDRTSNLESLLATLQRLPAARVVVLYEPEHAASLAKLRGRFPVHAALPHPVSEAAMAGVLAP